MEKSPCLALVRFDRYGDVEVLKVVDVERGPVLDLGRRSSRVRATAISPGEAGIRRACSPKVADDLSVQERERPCAGRAWPAGRPPFRVGDEVIGFTDGRASHAEVVAVDAGSLAASASRRLMEVAGSLFVTGDDGVRSRSGRVASRGDTVAVSGAMRRRKEHLAVQLAVAQGKVVGLASERHHEWLRAPRSHPVAYGDDVVDRIGPQARGRSMPSSTRSEPAT